MDPDGPEEREAERLDWADQLERQAEIDEDLSDDERSELHRVYALGPR